MDIIRHSESLALGRGGSGGELAGLHSVIQAEGAEIQEWRENIVDTVVEKIVQLSFSRHRKPDYGNFHLVLFERDVVTVEIATVINVL